MLFGEFLNILQLSHTHSSFVTPGTNPAIKAVRIKEYNVLEALLRAHNTMHSGASMGREGRKRERS